MIITPNYDKYEMKKQWHIWFAWHPVWIDESIYWLTKVKRKGRWDVDFELQGSWDFQYEALENKE